MRDYKIDYEGIGQNIRSQRIQKGLSQEGLARQIGISKAYMSQIETGKKHPALEICLSIANRLDMSMDEMLCGDLKRSEHVYYERFQTIFEDCDPLEIQLMETLLKDAKRSMTRYKKHLQAECSKAQKANRKRHQA